MKQPKLNYRFHNPNTAEASAEFLLRLFIESGAKKVEQAIKEAANQEAKAEIEQYIQPSGPQM